MLDGEESEIMFVDHPSDEMSVSSYFINWLISKKPNNRKNYILERLTQSCLIYEAQTRLMRM